MLTRKLSTERTKLATTTWYYVIGPEGAAQFMLITTKPPLDSKWALDLGIHSPRPLFDGHESMGKCDLIGRECYYSGSTRLAESLLRDFDASGANSDFLWERLEDFYGQTFDV